MELMPITIVQPGAEINDDGRRRKKRFESPYSFKKPHKTDYKVVDLVLQKMIVPTSREKPGRGNLLATVEAPRIVQELMKEFFHGVPKNRYKNIELIGGYQTAPDKNRARLVVPIGIRKSAYNSWINALLQFIIFLPSISEMFIYTPHSLSAFLDFITSYQKDQMIGRKVATGLTHTLVEGLRKKFPQRQFRKGNLFEILSEMMASIPAYFTTDEESSDLLALHPSWRFVFEQNLSQMEEKIEASMRTYNYSDSQKMAPSELLIGISSPRFSQPIPKKHLSFLNNKVLFELDAFIEFRSDEYEKGTYLTYLKIGTTWFQCDDTRIIQIRPINLSIALRRSLLLHYKKQQRI